jgi:O-methyltransferase
MNSNQEPYLQLMKKSLCGSLDIHFPANWSHSDWSSCFTKEFHARPLSGSALTMNGIKCLDFIEDTIKRLANNHVDGDILIAGCWRGGMAIFAQACLRVYEPKTARKIWCADTFIKRELGWKQTIPLKIMLLFFLIMPKSWAHQLINYIIKFQGFSSGIISNQDLQTTIRYIHSLPWTGSHASESDGLSDMLTGFERYELMDQNICPLVGFFSDTLEKADIKSISLLISDSDLYQSTYETLEIAYPKLVTGGCVVIDDYQLLHDCCLATEAYRTKHSITEQIGYVDHSAIFWQKSNAC